VILGEHKQTIALRFVSRTITFLIAQFFAPRALQLYFRYLTGAFSRLLNDKVRQKFSSEVFHNRKNFVLVCPSVPAFAAIPLESFSGLRLF
jgi:hypothetical protein